ncbi:MAG: hypothetical protein IPL53_24785 [Ignavibacteria bacterium]|nr:hypothetical protein [Ignavibacteria bacterium]
MKIYKLLTILLLLITVKFSEAQTDDGKKKFKEEINKIMKSKLIDSLGMDEMTADKFISLYKDNNKQIRDLSKEKRALMESIELDPSAFDVEQKFDKMLEIETSILDKKKSFYQDMKSFLTPQQIAKTMILRKKMVREIKKEFNKHKKDGRKNQKNEK